MQRHKVQSLAELIEERDGLRRDRETLLEACKLAQGHIDHTCTTGPDWWLRPKMGRDCPGCRMTFVIHDMEKVPHEG